MESHLLRGAVARCLLLCAGFADEPIGSRVLGLAPAQVFRPVTAQTASGNAGTLVGTSRFYRHSGLTELSFSVYRAIGLAYLLLDELRLISPLKYYLLLSGEPLSKAVREHVEQPRHRRAHVLGAEGSRR